MKEFGPYIVADPKICHGKLTFRGTRIMVKDILYQVTRGEPWDKIVSDWGGRIRKEAIADAVRLACEALNRSVPELQLQLQDAGG